MIPHSSDTMPPPGTPLNSVNAIDVPIVPPVPLTTPEEDETLHALHFDYPGSDIILRSCDSHDFHVPRLYLVNSSPVLRELTRGVRNTSDVASEGEKEPLPVVKLSESGATLHSLLTFIFPVAPVLPSTTETIVELLAVAQKYQMDSVLTHIRGAISRQDPPFIRPETAHHIYFLAQQHELHQEALQAARVTLRLSITIESLDDKFELPEMSGAYSHELWKYHERVRADLKFGLLKIKTLKKSGLSDGTENSRCRFANSYNHTFKQWLIHYTESIVKAPHISDLMEFEHAWALHVEVEANHHGICPCARVSSQVIRNSWEALKAVFHATIEKADSTLALVKEEPTSENSELPSVPLCLDIPDANIIVRSSDQANFRVHKSVLAMSSPFFKDLLSLPQPPDDELVDGLPVVALPEGTGLLNSLISLLYPTSPVIPGSYEKVFALLAACQKYDMVSTRSYIRDGIRLRTFPVPVGNGGFRAYAIASNMGLIPEMENAARLTLGQPMTFESIGEDLRLFKGRALCDLVRYRVVNNSSLTCSGGGAAEV